MAWPSARYKTATDGGSWVPADMNGVQDQYLRSAGITRDDLETAITQQGGFTTTASGHGGAATRRGKSIIATEETITSTTYALMTTPDRVQNVVLPTDGLIAVNYHAEWKGAAGGAGVQAAIFVGSNQLKKRDGTVQETSPHPDPPTYKTLTSFDYGLEFNTQNSPAAPVTTGQLAGLGVLLIHAAAGTYDVSVRFKASSGSVSVKERKLWVWTVGF